MQSEPHLALVAVLTALRRTGALDRQAIKAIVEALDETAAKARPHCAATAEELRGLAAALREGPVRSCSISIADRPKGEGDHRVAH